MIHSKLYFGTDSTTVKAYCRRLKIHYDQVRYQVFFRSHQDILCSSWKIRTYFSIEAPKHALCYLVGPK